MRSFDVYLSALALAAACVGGALYGPLAGVGILLSAGAVLLVKELITQPMSYLVAFLVLVSPALAYAQDQAPTVVTTTADTMVNLGDIFSSLLSIVVTFFAVPFGALLINFALKLVQGAGVSVTEARKTQLQGLVVNGINWAAKELGTQLQGKMTVDVKSRLIKEVIDYVQLHGADLLKSLGVKPDSPEIATAVAARVEKALNDPSQPTPPAVTPPSGQVTKVVVTPAAPVS